MRPPQQRTLAAVSAVCGAALCLVALLCVFLPIWCSFFFWWSAVRRAPTGLIAMHRWTEHYSNHQRRQTPSEPSSPPPPPFPLRGACKLPKGGGCALRAGKCPPRGWQQGRDQPTACGTVNVIRRREIRVWGGGGGRRVGQEWVRKRGTRERQ